MISAYNRRAVQVVSFPAMLGWSVVAGDLAIQFIDLPIEPVHMLTDLRPNAGRWSAGVALFGDMFKRALIANLGDIALRDIRA